MLWHDLHGNWDVNVCGCFRFAYGNLPGDQKSLLFGQGGNSHCLLVFVRRRGNAPQTVTCGIYSLIYFCLYNYIGKEGEEGHGGRICPWTMLGRTCPWMKCDEVGSGANVTLVQGRMWPLLLRGRCNSFRASKGFFPTLESHIHMLCDVPAAISINFQDTMDTMVYHCYVVTSISSNFEDALDATFQQPFQSTSSTLWMLRCNTHFEQLGRHFLDATFQQPFQSTSSTLWMLRCNIHFEQLGRRPRCYVPTAIWINFQGHYGCYGVPLLCCNIHFEQLRRRFGCYLPRAISINFQDTMGARL